MDKPYEKMTLPNGLRVIYVPFRKSDFVSVSLLGKVGRRAERGNEIGAAHFLEHLFFGGTKRRPSSFEINKVVEHYGAASNGSTGLETVEYWVKILSDHKEIAFDFLSDIFFNSLLNEIEREKKVIAEEAAGSRDSNDYIIAASRLKTFFPGQAISRTIYDEEPNLININKDILNEYMDRVYSAPNFVLGITGDIKREEAFHFAEKYFSQLKRGEEVKFDKAEIPEGLKIDITNKDIVQSRISIGFKGFDYNSGKDAELAAMQSVLGGGGITSRLFDRLRTKLHLVYSTGASQRSFSDTGFFYIVASMAENKIQEAINVIRQEIDRMTEEPISEDEMERAKNNLLSSLFTLKEKRGSYLDLFTSQELLSDKIETLEDGIRKIKALSVKDIQNVAKEIFTSKPKINVLTKNPIDLKWPES